MPATGIPAEGGDITRPAPAKPKQNKKRARVLIDKRYALGRRVKQLTAVFRERLGPSADDPVTAAALARAAETVVLSEHMRARMLRGESVSFDDVTRLSRTADLLTRRLLDSSNATQRPSLGELLNGHDAHAHD